MTVAFIGAGSVEFTRNVVTDLCGYPEFRGELHVALYDISAERLAPASASRRSRVAVTVALAPDCSDIRRASRSACSSRSALMSYSVSRSWPRNSG